jgi:hypothetical protein
MKDALVHNMDLLDEQAMHIHSEREGARGRVATNVGEREREGGWEGDGGGGERGRE